MLRSLTRLSKAFLFSITTDQFIFNIFGQHYNKLIERIQITF